MSALLTRVQEPRRRAPLLRLPARPEPVRQAVPRLVVAGAALLVAYLLLLLSADDSSFVRRMTDLSFVVFPGIASAAAFDGARRFAAQRRTWSLIGVAMGIWTAGGVVWCLYAFTRGTVPFPSVADVGFLGYVLPSAAALLLLPLAERSRQIRMEILLDSAVIAVSVLFCVWAIVLQPVLAVATGSGLERLVLIAYPTGDILTISLVLATVMRVRSADLRGWLTLMLGLLVLACTDLLYVALVARDAYHTGAAYNVLWAVAFMLVALASCHGGLSQPGGRRLSVAQAMIPYAAMASAVAVGFVRPIGPSDEPALSVLAVTLLVLASVRQFMVVWAKTRLADQLERDVLLATRELRGEREFLRAIVDSLHAGVVACDRTGALTFYNRATAQLHSDPEVLRLEHWMEDLRCADGSAPLVEADVPLFRALRGERVEEVEFMISPDQAPGVAVAASGTALRDESGSIVGAVVAMHDVTEQRRHQQALERQAARDHLTGLGNRAAFTAELSRRLAADDEVCVLLLDLDDFKNINDSLGHDAGDQYLVECGRRVVALLPTGAAVYRLGGDEFVVVLDPLLSSPVTCAQAVLAAVAAPARVAGTQVQITASIGLALSRPGYHTAGELLKAADLALYVAKADGKGRVAAFEERQRTAAQERLALENDLRQAITRRELQLVYQPIVEVATGRMGAVEALLRWTHPDRGAVSPVEFIPVAEQCGLILPLGEWVLQQACAQLLLWDAAGGDSTFRVTVNVSTRQLERPGLLEVLDRCLSSGVHPSRLVLEVTETALTLDSAAAMETMHAIRGRGVHLAVDDFGTGYSSLSRLRSAPVSRIKIDRSFISEIVGPEDHVPIVEATMAMARGLGMGVVAEGVETIEQLRYLGAGGCPEVQGYLLSRPIAAEAVLRCMSARPWAGMLPLPAAGASAAGSFQELVELAVDGQVGLEQLIQPLLAAFAAATGLATTYLTEVRLEEDVQEIRFVQNPTPGGVEEGLVVPWSQSLCKRALEEGPRRTDDAVTAYVGTEVARELQLASYMVEPVRRPNGELYGTLCGASSQPSGLSESDSATLRMYARLIEQKLNGSVSQPPPAVNQPDLQVLQERRRCADELWQRTRALLSGLPGNSGDRQRRAGLLKTADAAWDSQRAAIALRADSAATGLRVVIADDDPLLRQVLSLLIDSEDNLCLVGQADSAWAAVGVVAAEQPDILVLDFNLGDAQAPEVIDHLRALSPGTRVLLHSARTDVHQLGQLMRVDRVVHKGADPRHLPEALRSLAR